MEEIKRADIILFAETLGETIVRQVFNDVPGFGTPRASLTLAKTLGKAIGEAVGESLSALVSSQVPPAAFHPFVGLRGRFVGAGDGRPLSESGVVAGVTESGVSLLQDGGAMCFWPLQVFQPEDPDAMRTRLVRG